MNSLTKAPPIAALLLMLGMAAAARVPAPKPPESLSAVEFSRLVRDLSEDGGYFHSDNFTSNETSYLHIVDKLRQLAGTGGAYIGVGPEQNFTYIARVRPQIAFIVDIRRQAIIQHLMYKAIFHLAPNRVEFLSLLLSRTLPKDKTPAANASITELLAPFDLVPADEKVFAANLAEIRRTIQEIFQFPLSESDQAGLEYVYKNFRDQGLSISFEMDGYRGGAFPSLKEILAGRDLHDRPGSFLAAADDYDFVRGMQRKNLIIPVVGDFAGKKALAAVGDYLRKNGLTVTAFYTSNVEQYLFQNSVFPAFAENVRKLPVTDKSFFIRSATVRYSLAHPARVPGHRSVALLEQISTFLRDFDAGAYQSYHDLVMTHYIAADNP
jgi:hypothetical protein